MSSRTLDRAPFDAKPAAQDLAWHGVLLGDVALIHSGWGAGWNDPEMAQRYCAMGPGLAKDAIEMPAERKVALIVLDTPFTERWPMGSFRAKRFRHTGWKRDCPS